MTPRIRDEGTANVQQGDTSKWWLGPRFLYWGLLLAAVVGVAALRRSVIWDGNLSYFDQGLLVFLAIVLLVPLVGEMEAFGFRLRGQIKEAKNELRDDIRQLHSVITSSVAVRNDIFNVTALPAPSEHVLRDLEAYVRQRQAETGLTGATAPAPERELDVPERARFLFSVRYALEEKINDLASLLGIEYRGVRQVLNVLAAEYLGAEDVSVFNEVWKIASKGIHGQPLDQHHVDYVREAYPYLIGILDSVERSYLDDG